MRKLTYLTVAGLLVGAAVPVSAKQAKHASGAVSQAPAAAAAVVDSFHAALERGDTAGAAALLADDVVIFESGGAERSKAEYAADHLGADAAFAKAVRRAVTRRTGRSDGRMAWIVTETTTKGTYNDRSINSVGMETMVLERDGATWRIKHIHWSSANVE